MIDLEALRREYGDFRIVAKRLVVDAEGWARWRRWGARHAFAAGAVVWNDRRDVLLVRHAPEAGWGDQWATPGGSAEANETPEEAVRREIREEAGVEIEILGLDLVNRYEITNGSEALAMDYLQFEARVRSGTPRPGHETVEVQWFAALPDATAYREDFEDLVRRRKTEQYRKAPNNA